MQMIFNICDEDDSGDVDYLEFVEQIRRIKHSGQQMVLNMVTDIKTMLNRLGRAMKVKVAPEEKLEEKENSDALGGQDGFEEVAIGSHVKQGFDEIPNGSSIKQGFDEIPIPKEIPPGSHEKMESISPGSQEKMERIQKMIQSKLPDVGEAGSGVTVMFGNEKLDRIVQLNENLVNVLTSVAQQSKDQFQLLNTLVDNKSTVKQPDPDPDVRPSEAEGDLLLQPTSTPQDCCRPFGVERGGTQTRQPSSGRERTAMLVTPSQWAAPPSCYRVV
jgi:hypothetical protein